MTLNDFIFSSKRPENLYRHIAFWAVWYISPIFWGCIVFGVPGKDIILTELIPFFGQRLLDLAQNVAYCYLIVYYLIPKYFDKKKHLRFISLTLLLTVITLTFYIFRIWYFQDIRSYNDPTKDEQLSILIWNLTRSFLTDGSPVVCGFLITVRVLKGYYQELEEKISLIKETSNAELQLLKAQIHPHFLFNTLNNIYSFTLNNPPKAAELVLKLSHTIQYMTNECEARLVLLENELKMINDYVELEKVRYGKRLKMEVEIKGDYKNKVIAPLLLIPFVENSFKHGSSKMLEYPWIRMQISITDKYLDFEISNSKPVNSSFVNGNNGIGLKNVRKRLQLLYPGEHQLEITADEHSYNVELRVPLLEIKSEEPSSIKTEGALAEEIYTDQ